MTPTYEFILWPNCRNNCTFCFQKEQLRCGRATLFSVEDMEKSLAATAIYITTCLRRGVNVMLVGGELFDTPQVHGSLCELLRITVRLLAYGTINELYVNTNLIYKNLDPIRYLLCSCREAKVLERVHFTTSYDFDGRFRGNTEKLMLSNLQTVAETFPDCRIFVNTMLSREACTRILEGTFSVKQFSEQYHCYVNLIPYIELIPEITAPRGLIVQALKKVDEELPGYVADYLMRIDINQEKHVLQYNRQLDTFDDLSCGIASCGHSVNFQRYSSNGSCFVCDMKQAFGL